MSTFTIQINENSDAGKTFKQLIEYFKNQSGIKVTENEVEIESPYDPEFVSKILDRSKKIKSKKLTRLNPDDVWGTIL
ncbi:MAG: DUF2683 family protein [Flavobacteriia bacterium]|jgi:uncharacterized lipoprotein YehR (DUF1307 family)